MKKLIPALCMLLIAATLMGTSTFAWFSMNTQVTATGMQVKAQAEGGIVISNSSKATWSSEATAQVTSAALYPTSHAANDTKWYHNKSNDANNAAAGQASTTYQNLDTITLSSTNEGVGYIESNANSTFDAGTDAAYYLLNNFTIKSSGDALSSTLYINQVAVQSSGALKDIDKALRVAIVVASTTYIYAPVDGATTTYRVAGSSEDTIAYTTVTGKNLATSVTTIPNTNDGIPVSIYVYFEGEDQNCKSTNISGITTNDLTVSVQFGTTTIS